ncbi:MAG TPA: ABC transporter permease [Candidatus Humimicrobiaceae bacterium]
MNQILKKNRILIYPGFLWFLVFFMLPLAVIFAYAFTDNFIRLGQPIHFTFKNFLIIFERKYYFSLLLRSLRISTITTVFSIAFAYPVSYFLAKKTKYDKLLIILLMVPFWVNYLIRTFAWKLLISENGVLNKFLLSIHLIQEPLKLLYTETAVIIGLIYSYTPMMVLPLYATISKIDDRFTEAALDLGASRIRAFFDITFRLSLTGIFAGTILVFIPALGSFAIPAILGGTDSLMIGNTIESQFIEIGNWNFGSAFTLALAAISLAMIFLYSRLFGLDSVYKNQGI